MELPQIIEGRRDVCGCEKAQKEWSIIIEIQQMKKRLTDVNYPHLKEGASYDGKNARVHYTKFEETKKWKQK